MKFLQRFAFSIFFAAAVFGGVESAAQTTRPDLNRARTYDVQHYLMRVSFDRAKKMVIGDTTVFVKPLAANLKVVELDAVGFSFKNVKLDGDAKTLHYRYDGKTVAVTLDKEYRPDEVIPIRISYTAVPKKGVYFVAPNLEKGKVINAGQIYTQGEPDEARHWLPSFDFPSDKATTEQIITVEKDETVIGNGELLSTTQNADGTATFHYKMPVPHSIYLTSFVVGKYAKKEDKYKEVPLGYYIYPGLESLVQPAYGKTKDMFRVFEELTGVPYQFNKYDQTIVSGFTFGGMENITATTMADTEIALVNNPLFGGAVEDLVSHELAHSWFGNLVTCKNWAELWLNEGFATFMEAAFREKMYGRENYIAKIRRDAETFMVDDAINRKRNGLFNQNAGNVAELFDRPATTYNKGGAVIHTLREEIGDEAFWKGVNIYLNRHKFANVETPDLLKAMEEASGKDLKWFFEQWVYGGGHPKLDVRQAWNEAAKTLNLVVTQTQKADKLTPEVFRLSLDLELRTASGIKSENVNVTKRTESFSFKLDGKPTLVKFDPSEKVPLKMVFMKPEKLP